MQATSLPVEFVDSHWCGHYAGKRVRAVASVCSFLFLLMANTKSAIKRIRQTRRQTNVNRRNRARLRTQVKKLTGAIAGGNGENAQDVLPATVSSIDRAVQKGVIKKNKASRMKSRLTRKVNVLSKTASE